MVLLQGKGRKRVGDQTKLGIGCWDWAKEGTLMKTKEWLVGGVRPTLRQYCLTDHALQYANLLCMLRWET